MIWENINSCYCSKLLNWKPPQSNIPNYPKDRKCSTCTNGFSNKATPSFPGIPQNRLLISTLEVSTAGQTGLCEHYSTARTVQHHFTVSVTRAGGDGATLRNGLGIKLLKEMHWRWGATPDLLHQGLHSNHPTSGTELQQLDPLPPSEAPSKAQIKFRRFKGPLLGRWIISPLSTCRPWGQHVAHTASCEVTIRLRDVTFPYNFWFSELLSHPSVPKYVFIVPEKWDLNIRKRFFIIKRRGITILLSYPKFCYSHWDQNTWTELTFTTDSLNLMWSL